jgi:ubiquinone/menaquinone biosynthesis C-methylase UbiE
VIDQHPTAPTLPDSAARKAQIRATFDRVASTFDAVGPACFAHFGRRLVEVAGVEPGQSVLDVATGRGAVLFPAAAVAGAAGEALGVDLSEGMVRETNAEAERRALRARARVMDAEHLDFPEATFDSVLCGFGVMFFPDQDQALAEFRRVLRSGGRVGLSTWCRSQCEDLREVLSEQGLDRGVPGWITEPVALRTLLEQAGFRDVDVRVDETVLRYADLDEYWRTAQTTSVARVLVTLDASQTARVRGALADRLAHRQGADGLHVDASALLAVASH